MIREKVRLSLRDSLRILDLLENPPIPNEKLLAAARSLPKTVTDSFTLHPASRPPVA